MHMCMYFLLECSKQCEQVCKLMLQWASDLFRTMAQRTHPMMYMDANSQFGIMDEQQVESDSIGMYGLGKENGMGTQIR